MGLGHFKTQWGWPKGIAEGFDFNATGLWHPGGVDSEPRRRVMIQPTHRLLCRVCQNDDGNRCDNT